MGRLKCPPRIFLLIILSSFLISVHRAESTFDKLIKRSKRDTTDEIGDALYDTDRNKREEIPVPSTKNVSEDSDSDTDDEADSTSDDTTDDDKSTSEQSASLNSSTSSEANDDTADNETEDLSPSPSKSENAKRRHVKADVVTVKDEQEKAEEIADKDVTLQKGMHSNVDHPMTNSELTKQYRPENDVSNGEMMGMDDSDSEPTKRDFLRTLPTTKTVTDTTDANLLHLTDSVLDLLNSEIISKRSNIINVADPLMIEKRDSEHAVADTHDMQDGGAPSHFQVDDKSADLEINANSAGVKVKAKPASLQVVSRPGSHGHEQHFEHPVEMFHEPMMHYHHPHHHHRHHHGHHHRRHHRPHHYEEEDEEMHHEMPHFFDVPRYGDTWGHGIGGGYGGGMGGGLGGGFGGGGYGGGFGGGFGRSYLPSPLRDSNAYGRSTVETALDPRLGAPSSANGFSTGLALPDSETYLMERLRAKLYDEQERDHLSQLDRVRESTLRAFADSALSERAHDIDLESDLYRHPDRLSMFSDRRSHNLDSSMGLGEGPLSLRERLSLGDRLTSRDSTPYHESSYHEHIRRHESFPYHDQDRESSFRDRGRESIPFRDRESEMEAQELEPKGSFEEKERSSAYHKKDDFERDYDSTRGTKKHHTPHYRYDYTFSIFSLLFQCYLRVLYHRLLWR